MASTLITMTNMMALNSKMAKIGPRKAPKKTPGSLMKQLGGGKGNFVYNIEIVKHQKANIWGITFLTI